MTFIDARRCAAAAPSGGGGLGVSRADFEIVRTPRAIPDGTHWWQTSIGPRWTPLAPRWGHHTGWGETGTRWRTAPAALLKIGLSPAARVFDLDSGSVWPRRSDDQ
jgi:hypothetical protein